MPGIIDSARFWDRAAPKYAVSPIKDMRGYERTIDRTRSLLDTSDTVLEIGCGTGMTALRLAPGVSRLVAADVSSEMISIARRKAEAEGLRNVEFTVVEAGSAPGSDGIYDAVLAFNLLHLVAERPTTIANVYRLLKPGGVFITKTPCLSEMNLLIRAAVPIMQFVGQAPFVSFFSASELENEIETAGFAIVERARHGSQRKDPRVFIVAQKPGNNLLAT